MILQTYEVAQFAYVYLFFYIIFLCEGCILMPKCVLLENFNKALNSQMPRHLISEEREWINEIPTVPIYYLPKPQPREQA